MSSPDRRSLGRGLRRGFAAACLLLLAALFAACADVAGLIPGDGAEVTVEAPEETPEPTPSPILTTPGPVFRGGQGGPPPSAIPDHQLARSVVQVQALGGSDAAPTVVRIGSGVVVDAEQHLILTSFPLVDPYRADGRAAYSTIGIGIAPEPGAPPQLVFEAEIVAAEPEAHLAILRVVRDYGEETFTAGDFTVESAYIGDVSSVGAGSPIRIFGHPAGGTAAGQAVSTTHGNVTGYRGETGHTGRNWLKTDTRLPAGLSGGPVFDTLGQLLGILVQPRYLPDAQVSHVRPLELAFPLIEAAQARTGQQAYHPPLYLRGNVPGSSLAMSDDGIWISRPAFAENAIEGLGTRDLLDYGTRFPAGISALYYEFVLMGVPAGAELEERWYLDGVQQDSLSSNFVWDGGLFGMISDRVAAPGASGLPSGRWRLDIRVDDELRATSTAYIGVEPREPTAAAFETGAFAAPDGSPGAPVTAGDEQLIAFFEFSDMDAAQQIEWTVWRNNQRIHQSPAVSWVYGTAGRYWVGYRPEGGVTSGTWEVEIHIDGLLVGIAEVTVP